jgi:molecular chaperone GrpE
MTDRPALLAQLLDQLQASPQPPEYLGSDYAGSAPEQTAPFDPYQMVGEWVALRHEVKQQNRLWQTTQAALQQSLEAEKLENTQLQQRLAELATIASTNQSQSVEQKRMLQDLLRIMDALDQACAYWRSQIVDLTKTAAKPHPWWRKLFASPRADLKEILSSNHQGLEVIRRSLLDLLRQKQVVPLEAEGKPFDPSYMYAMGRQASRTVAENTVIQEVVRGYLWQDQILREAQVMVAVKPGESL